MALPVASELARKDRLWPAVLVSLAVHAGLAAVAIVRRPPPIDLGQTPIVARLVRLGEKRPEEWLPQREAAPEPAPPAPAPGAPAPPAAPAPGKTAAAAKPSPRTAPAQHAGKPAGGGDPLASALSRVKRDVDRDRWGDPNGDPAGDSSEGSAGDRYLALVQRALQSKYNLPATISDRERMYLNATVTLLVQPDGAIASWEFRARSGNDAFDAALERAIRSVRLPPPPADLRDRYRRSGIDVKFTIPSRG